MNFVTSVRVTDVSKPLRIKGKHLLLAVFWVLVAVKCVLADWAIGYWEIPFRSVFIWAPTVVAAVICTILFLAGEED